MALFDINLQPSRRELRVFSLVLLALVGIIGLLAIAWHGAGLDTAAWVWGIGAAVVAAGLIFPPLMRMIFVGISVIAYPIGWVLSHALLAFVFYVVMTPIGLLLRLFGKDPMLRRFDREAAGYWIPRRPVTDKRRYFRQF